MNRFGANQLGYPEFKWFLIGTPKVGAGRANYGNDLLH